MSKNIVILSDGTAKEGGRGANTNVYRLFRVLENRTPHQVVFYDAGLGTGFRKLSGSAFGRGISENIKECYRFLFENYEAGDKVYLLGFSRGATTVRSLSAFIHLFGVLPKSRPELIGRAYKIYRTKNPDKRTEKAADFINRHHTMWTSVHFLGVWDTVVALGIPSRALDVFVERVSWWRHKFHDLTLSPSVNFGYHALAVDDERRVFHPKLWDAEVGLDQSIRQVWFPGMHSDVGGGSPSNDLADITLDWMIQQGESHGLLFHGREEKLNLAPEPAGEMSDSRAGLGRLYSRKVRTWDRSDAPVIHQSVLDRAEALESYRPWILDQFEAEAYEIEPSHLEILAEPDEARPVAPSEPS